MILPLIAYEMVLVGYSVAYQGDRALLLDSFARDCPTAAAVLSHYGRLEVPL